MITAMQMFADGQGWRHMNGWAWVWMALAWLMFIGLIAYAVRRSSHESARRMGAGQILAERFARGELSVEEFEMRRASLNSGDSAS